MDFRHKNLQKTVLTVYGLCKTWKRSNLKLLVRMKEYLKPSTPRVLLPRVVKGTQTFALTVNGDSWVSPCRRRTLLSHRVSRGFRFKSKAFFFLNGPPTHYICQSSWTDVSTQQCRSLGVESVTVTASHPADCCTQAVCVCVHWNRQLRCVGASPRARWSDGEKGVITYGPQHHTGVIRDWELSGRLIGCD